MKTWITEKVSNFKIYFIGYHQTDNLQILY